MLGSVPKFLGNETRQAIAAAKRAFPAWAAKTAGERAAILRRWNDLMLANADDLAMIMTLEQGKAACRVQGRGRLFRLLHRMVRRKRESASMAT